MGVNQTTMTDTSNFVMGSAKIELWDNGSWLDLELARDISFNVEGTPLDVAVGNTSKRYPLKGLASQTGNMAFTLLSRKLSNLYKLRGGVDKYTVTTATPVTGATQNIVSGTWEYKVPYEISYPSSVTPTVTVVSSVNGALVENTDFTIQKKTKGSNIYTIIVIDSLTVTTEAQDLALTINYTPIAKETLSTGGLVEQKDQKVRLTNLTGSTATITDVNSYPELALSVGTPIFRVREITAHMGTVTNGLNYTFTEKDATDPVVVANIEMLFTEDDTMLPGEQLYKEDSYVIKQ